VRYPALDVSNADSELVMALADDYAPTAADDHGDSVTIFFSNSQTRDLAHQAILSAWPGSTVTARDVDDEDWARRSQHDLDPVTVGRLTVFPQRHTSAAAIESATRGAPTADRVAIVIQPSMGFGTGHHATTRLCLGALQSVRAADSFVVDVGTGSGILAIAARLLGASQVLGIDTDEDALQAAAINLELNSIMDGVRLARADAGTELGDVIRSHSGNARSQADIVTANLTGALLVKIASALSTAVARNGQLILSGLQASERQEVLTALADAGLTEPVWEQEEDGWIAVVLQHAGEKFNSRQLSPR
jgi:ribosomal protein L11 methyltransferase